MKKLFITLIFLFTLLPHGYILADEKTITISGRVQNKTENSDSSKEYIIKLFKIINNSEEIIEISNGKINTEIDQNIIDLLIDFKKKY